MIPSMIFLGLVFGRWWRSTLIAVAICWPIMLATSGVVEGPPIEQAGTLLAGSLLALANAAVGVAVHQAFLFAARGVIRMTSLLRRGSRRSAQP